MTNVQKAVAILEALGCKDLVKECKELKRDPLPTMFSSEVLDKLLELVNSKKGL